MTDRPLDAADPGNPPPRFTRREWEMVLCLRRGLSNREIAKELRIAEQTVKNILSGLYEKLGVKSRLQVLVKTMQLD